MLEEKIYFGIGGERISHYASIELEQTINDHHTFTVKVPQAVIEDPLAVSLTKSKIWHGKTINIVLANRNHFLGIVESTTLEKVDDHVGNLIVIKGHSKTILLEKVPSSNTFEDTTLDEIVKRVIRNNADERLQTEVKAEYKYPIPYQVQYSETDFNYLKRLARQYAEWLFYDGEKLFFGKIPKQFEGKKLMYGTDISKLDICLQTKPHQFSGYTYDIDRNKFVEASAKGDIEGLPPITRGMLEVADKLYTKPAYGAEEYTTLGFEGYLSLAKKNKQLAELADMHYVVGTTDNRTLRIGQRITIFAREIEEIPYMDKRWVAGKVFYKETEISTYIITELYHKATDIGEYQNTFKALPAFVRKLPLPEVEKPTVHSEQAVVIDNADPEGKGRVRVRLQWQNNHNGQTPWIFVLSPDAGRSKAVQKNRGFAFTPDVGDNVVVFYLNGDPLQPFVMGSFYDGLSGAGGGANNNQRALTSREGSMLKFDDGDKSAKLNDASENYLLMDGSGNTRLYAPNLLHLIAKNLIIDVSNDMTVNVQNDLLMNIAEQAVFNVFQKMGINTPHLQQLISSTYHTQAGKALINSQNEIKLESPEMYIAGQKKLYMHSDEVASLNSKGIVKVDGKEGNKHSNKAEAYETVKETTDAKAMVAFRPRYDFNGEFFFDWMRTGEGNDIGQTALEGNIGDVDYKTILGYYRDNNTNNAFVPDADANLNGEGDMYEKLKNEFEIYKFTAMSDDNKPITYLAPYLGIYKHDTQPKATAVLEVQIQVKERPDELIIEYDTDFFEVTEYVDENQVFVSGTSPRPTTTTNITEYENPNPKIKKFKLPKGAVGSKDIQINCIATFDEAKYIKAYTIKEDPNDATKKIKKLAGVLRVLPNAKSKRKIQKIVLVDVITNINAGRVAEHGLDTNNAIKQVKYLRKILRQAMIDPVFEVKKLDLTGVAVRNHFNSTYVDNGVLKTYYSDGVVKPRNWKDLIQYLNEKFIRQGNRYPNHKIVFFMPHKGCSNKNTDKEFCASGYNDNTFTNLIVVLKEPKPNTVPHEILHALGIPHTWDNKNHIKPNVRARTELNGKHSFKKFATFNIMDYTENTKDFIYIWQAQAANQNATTEPENYIPNENDTENINLD